MTDLSEFVGQSALTSSLQKKRDKLDEKIKEKIQKAQSTILPMQEQLEKMDAVLAMLKSPSTKLSPAEAKKATDSALEVANDAVDQQGEQESYDRPPLPNQTEQQLIRPTPIWQPDQPLNTLGDDE